MKSPQRFLSGLILIFVFLCSGEALFGQSAVIVTLVADETTLTVGETTTVRVYGQVDSAIEAQSQLIFSWYVDLLVDDSAGALSVDWNSLTMAASDSPDGSATTASAGVVDVDGNCRGIHNTFFLTNPSAGVGAAVELLSFEVTATAQSGTAMIGVAEGTTVPTLTDFLVSKVGGGEFTGGVYPAMLAIEANPVVLPDPDSLDLSVIVEPGGARVQFSTVMGVNYRVEFRDSLAVGGWTPLPGAPHNSGDVLDTSAVGIPKRFYQVVYEVP